MAETTMIPTQESQTEQSQQQVIDGSPINFHYNNSCQFVSSSYATVCSLLKNQKDLEDAQRLELEGMKKKLEEALTSIKALKECTDASYLQIQNQVSNMKRELEENKSMQLGADGMIRKNSKNIADLQKVVNTITSKNDGSGPTTSQQGNPDTTETVEDSEARQQMEERRQKRKSAHLEADSLGKMKEFATTKEQFDRDRLDSGVSISSNQSTVGLILDN